MTRISKQGRRRAVSPRRPRPAGPPTGPKKDALPMGYRQHVNAVPASQQKAVFIPVIH